MARQMVGQRKGMPAKMPVLGLEEAKGRGADYDGAKRVESPSGADPEQSDGDVCECPNCKCQFDDETGKVVKPGAPVLDADQGAGLDTIDSAEPTPGKFGTAADAARGTDALSHLLGSLTGGR